MTLAVTQIWGVPPRASLIFGRQSLFPSVTQLHLNLHINNTDIKTPSLLWDA